MDLIALFRDKGYRQTNFFPDKNRMQRWCEDGSLSYYDFNGAMILLHLRGGFSSIYFVAHSADTLSASITILQELNPEANYVIDLLGLDPVRIPLERACMKGGFRKLAVLQRMGRTTPHEKYKISENIETACTEDIPGIYSFIRKYFDPVIEQLPEIKEVSSWQEKKSILVCRANEQIKGFVIFDLTPATLYLRYWFVHPEVRGKGVGSDLIRSFFAKGNTTKRQFFWVLRDNVKAIEKYQHYGFRFESLVDTVMTNF